MKAWLERTMAIGGISTAVVLVVCIGFMSGVWYKTRQEIQPKDVFESLEKYLGPAQPYEVLKEVKEIKAILQRQEANKDGNAGD